VSPAVNATIAGPCAKNLELIDFPEDPDDEQAGHGSTDSGNAGQKLPAIRPDIPVSPDGVFGHSREFAEWARSPMARIGTIPAAKALALTAVDLLASPGSPTRRATSRMEGGA
jgi:hypothetical protein